MPLLNLPLKKKYQAKGRFLRPGLIAKAYRHNDGDGGPWKFLGIRCSHVHPPAFPGFESVENGYELFTRIKAFFTSNC